MFVLWALLFFVIREGTKAAIGVSVNRWAIMLWVLGGVSGAIVARTVAKNEPRFLLRDELGVGVFLGLVRLQAFGKSGKETF